MTLSAERFPSKIHYATDKASKGHYTIFLCPGNPGLLAYYLPFLNDLIDSLQDSATVERLNVTFDIHGRSMSGFEVDAATRKRPYSLVEQIENTEAHLIELINSKELQRQNTRIILIGHSVGAYIVLEMLRRRRIKDQRVDVKAGILLFPTIVDIAKSPSGLKVKVRNLELLNSTALTAMPDAGQDTGPALLRSLPCQISHCTAPCSVVL